jgi:hypothetical protein
MTDTLPAVIGDVLEPLDTLGVQCRQNLERGNSAIAAAAKVAVEVRLRIEEGEVYAGGFKAWWATYCEGGSPWPAPKLLTAGGWRETKKTGVIAELPKIEAKVAEIKTARAEHMRATRDEKSSRELISAAPRAGAGRISDIDPTASEPLADKIASVALDDIKPAATRPMFDELVAAWDLATEDERRRFLRHAELVPKAKWERERDKLNMANLGRELVLASLKRAEAERDEAREKLPDPPAPEVRRDKNGAVLDPIPVVLKRVLVRLRAADKIDEALTPAFRGAEDQFALLGHRVGVDHICGMLKGHQQAQGHRAGSITDVEQILADEPPAPAAERFPKPEIAAAMPKADVPCHSLNGKCRYSKGCQGAGACQAPSKVAA